MLGQGDVVRPSLFGLRQRRLEQPFRIIEAAGVVGGYGIIKVVGLRLHGWLEYVTMHVGGTQSYRKRLTPDNAFPRASSQIRFLNLCRQGSEFLEQARAPGDVQLLEKVSDAFPQALLAQFRLRIQQTRSGSRGHLFDSRQRLSSS